MPDYRSHYRRAIILLFYLDYETMIYFALSNDGLIYNLGDHGDYQAAEDTAESIGIDVIWMLGEDTAREWNNTLTHHLGEAA